MKKRFRVSIRQVAGNLYGLFIGDHLTVMAYDRTILEEMLEDEYSRD